MRGLWEASSSRDRSYVYLCAYLKLRGLFSLFAIAEMVAVKEVYDAKLQGTDRVLLVFNGELDRIRSAYYPAVFYPGLAKMAKEWLPQFCQAYYIHNFKGRTPGTPPPPFPPLSIKFDLQSSIELYLKLND